MSCVGDKHHHLRIKHRIRQALVNQTGVEYKIVLNIHDFNNRLEI